MDCCGCFGGLAKPRRDGKIILGYWGIRGLGAPLRMLLDYVGADYEDKQYTDPAEWFGKDKLRIKKINPLANLPYVEDGEVIVCQTNAVFEYLGDRFRLNGKNRAQRRLNAQVLAEIYDLRNTVIQLVYPFTEKCRTNDEFEQKMAKHVGVDCRPFLDKLEKFVEMNGGPYSCGSNVCTADFHLFEMLDQHELYSQNYGHGEGSVLQTFKKLGEFYRTFRALPKLQGYFEGPAYKLRCNAQKAYTSSHGTKIC